MITDAERERRREESTAYSITQGAYAALATTVVVAAGHILAQRMWPAYRAFNWRPKLFWLSSAPVAAFYIRMEQAHVEKMSAWALADEAAQMAEDEAARVQAAQMQQQWRQQPAPSAGAKAQLQ
jgi:hypothetical protein